MIFRYIALLFLSTHTCVQIYICQQSICSCRYIGLLANFTFDTGVRENVQKEKTSQLAASMFKQVSLASANSYHYLSSMQIAHEKCQLTIRVPMVESSKVCMLDLQIFVLPMCED